MYAIRSHDEIEGVRRHRLGPRCTKLEHHTAASLAAARALLWHYAMNLRVVLDCCARGCKSAAQSEHDIGTRDAIEVFTKIATDE